MLMILVETWRSVSARKQFLTYNWKGAWKPTGPGPVLLKAPTSRKAECTSTQDCGKKLLSGVCFFRNFEGNSTDLLKPTWFIWSNYSDRKHDQNPQKVAFWKGNPLFQGNLGWGNIMIWPDSSIRFYQFIRTHFNLFKWSLRERLEKASQLILLTSQLVNRDVLLVEYNWLVHIVMSKWAKDGHFAY